MTMNSYPSPRTLGIVAGATLVTLLSTSATASTDNPLLEILLSNGVINNKQFQELSKKGSSVGNDELIAILAQNGAITKDQAGKLTKGNSPAQSAPAAASPPATSITADGKSAAKKDADAGYVHLNEKGLEFGSADGNFKAKIGGRIQVDSQINWNDPETPIGSGLSNGVGFRRARLYTEGVMFRDYEYRFEYDWARNNGGLQGITDAYLKYIHFKPFAITIGQQNEGKTLDSVMSNNYLTFIERSLPLNAFIESGPNSKYQIGAMAETFDKAWGIPYVLRGGITTESVGAPGPGNSSDNSWGNANSPGGTNGVASNNQRNAFSGDTSYQLVSRAVIVPFKDDNGNLIHTGAWGSWRSINNNFNENGSLRTGGWAYQTAPDTAIDRTNWANTGNLTNTKCIGGTYNSSTGECAGGKNVLQHQVDSVGMFGAELAGAVGPVHAQAEYIFAQINGYGYDGSDLLQGAYVQTGWFLTGETRPYDEKKGVWNRLIPNANFLQGDGWGAWELAARYDWLNMNTTNINGGALNIGTFGVNWYLTPRVRLMTDWVHVFATNTGQALDAAGSCGFPAQGKNASVGCFNGLTPDIWQTAVRIDF
ncbi:MAG: OprO/OprP family phosphate-selective porin [Methylococcaceae bacterium]|jgi:phosphate-selective porin OprO/OprP